MRRNFGPKVRKRFSFAGQPVKPKVSVDHKLNKMHQKGVSQSRWISHSQNGEGGYQVAS